MRIIARTHRSPLIVPFAIVALATMAVACDGAYSTATYSRTLTSINVAIKANPAEVGQTTRAFITLLDQAGDSMPLEPMTFSSSAPSVASVDAPSGVIHALAAGTTEITVSVGGLTARAPLTVIASSIRINEVRPSADPSTGFVELYNLLPTAVDLSAWTLSGRDILHTVTLPTGTTIAGKGFLVVRQGDFPDGLLASDAIHLVSRFGAEVDGFFYSNFPATSFARCPDGTGPLVASALASAGQMDVCAPGAH